MDNISEQLYNADPYHILYIGAVAGALTAIYTFHRWMWPAMKRLYRNIQWFLSHDSDHKEMMGALASIQAKLEPNGGSHMADALNRIEDAVAHQGARQLSTFHMSAHPIFETNSIGEVTFVNAAFKKQFGIDNLEAHGMGWVNVIEPAQRQSVITKWLQAVKDKRAFNEYVDLIGVHGDTTSMHIVAHVLRDGDKMLGHYGEIYSNGENHDTDV